ncbi:MAG: hypothetical protein JJE04_26375 [Acidobacteriia bacterium]|nr:hypothetical protein [Terriglobia bacterium]
MNTQVIANNGDGVFYFYEPHYRPIAEGRAVAWEGEAFLSDGNLIPQEAKAANRTTFRAVIL